MIPEENNNINNEETKKTVYKETEERINEKESDEGETSSVADLGRTDLISRPERANKPLGSSHEPGTAPGSNF